MEVTPHQAAIALGAAGALAWVLSVSIASKENKAVNLKDLAIAAVPMVGGIALGYWVLTRED